MDNNPSHLGYRLDRLAVLPGVLDPLRWLAPSVVHEAKNNRGWEISGYNPVPNVKLELLRAQRLNCKIFGRNLFRLWSHRRIRDAVEYIIHKNDEDQRGSKIFFQ